MIIQDIARANADQFEADLAAMVRKLRGVAHSAREGGDFRQTVETHLSIVEAALAAAKEQRLALSI